MSDSNTSPGPLGRADARWDSLTRASAQPVIVLERVARAAGRDELVRLPDGRRVRRDRVRVPPRQQGQRLLRRPSVLPPLRRLGARRDPLRIARRDHDCVVAVLGAAPPRQARWSSSRARANSASSKRTLGDLSEVCFGAYPGDENDGTNALTWTVPDADGGRTGACRTRGPPPPGTGSSSPSECSAPHRRFVLRGSFIARRRM
ncbi:hypothetical protein ACRAWF_45500 [Streptomyces sp. L7]